MPQLILAHSLVAPVKHCDLFFPTWKTPPIVAPVCTYAFTPSGGFIYLLSYLLLISLKITPILFYLLALPSPKIPSMLYYKKTFTLKEEMKDKVVSSLYHS